MKRVAVIGGGPAGSTAAERLARSGLETWLLDEKLAWEKPCGGGVTFKAYQQYPFLLSGGAPKRLVSGAVLEAPGERPARLDGLEPICIFARRDLNQMLLQRAAAAGARILKSRAIGLHRHHTGWRVKTRDGELEVDFVILATGARNSFRELGTQLRPADTMTALGYYVDGKQEDLEIVFLGDVEGYIWVFPRSDHLSVGICGKGLPAQVLRRRLENYMQRKGYEAHPARFYSHLLPCLESPAWRANRIAGPGWIAAGDAAGFVDPITGEGIYYAIRSGDLAGSLLAADQYSSDQIGLAYSRLVASDFGEDLAFAATLARRFYLGKFLGVQIPSRTVRFVPRSASFAEILRDIFAGIQPYRTLKKRLLSRFWIIHKEAIFQFWWRRLAHLGEEYA
ncbi:MAG: NAD(P)/FAD-dependent oxidoreductase [Bryobacteraceae bacterium]|nr:NAD(P)/FAD-dependent oxidoreductase [Bryobacteraceae bacterium]MDW8377432.1 NAD(P)/FAD-dependent oxidoreductase [Bryobacterales bacterium]